MRTRLFAYYFLASSTAASLGYILVRATFGKDVVFGGLYRMFVYHEEHPFQYIALACLVFSVLGTIFTPHAARLAGWRRVFAIFGIMLGSILIASAPGGVLYSIHDMQAGYFPSGRRFWDALLWGASTGLQVGWLVIAASIPYNFLGLVVGYLITSYGVRLTPNVA